MLLYPFRYIWWLISSVRRSIGRPPEYVLFVIDESLPALPDPPRPLWQRFVGRSRLSVKELGERFEAIGRDTRIKGVVLHLRATAMPMATLQDLRELVAELRRKGKRVVAWAPSYTTGAYYFACACDEILLMPTGIVGALGFATTGMFLADGLARIGVSGDFIQVSPYKSAADPLTKSAMSPELRAQLTWLLDSQFAELVGAVAASRGLDAAGAKELIDCSPYGEDAAEKHAVDAALSEEDLPARLGGTIGTWDRARRKMRVPRSSAPSRSLRGADADRGHHRGRRIGPHSGAASDRGPACRRGPRGRPERGPTGAPGGRGPSRRRGRALRQLARRIVHRL